MINSLTTRIFAIFWFTLALVLMLVLMVPKLDSRQLTVLLDSEQRQGTMLEQHIEAELAMILPMTSCGGVGYTAPLRNGLRLGNI